MPSATVAVINKSKQLLILRRGKTAPWMPGRYCLPGGHVEPNEDVQYGAVRELSEETGIIYFVEDLNPLKVIYSNGYSKVVWIATISNPQVTLNWEHDDYRWITYGECFNYELVPRLYGTIKTLYSQGFIK